MQTTLFNSNTINIDGISYNVKSENEVLYVFWLNEPIKTKFNTIVDIGIISKDKIC